MRFTRLTTILAAVVGVLAAQPAPAHVPPQSTELDWHIGMVDYDSKYSLDYALEDDLMLGIYIARNIAPGWGIEGGFGLTPGDQVKGYFGHVNGVYNINVQSWERFVPFLTAGVGLLSLAPEVGDSQTDMAINFGGGAKVFLTPRLAIRGDVRDHMVFADPDATNNLQFTAGLSYFLISGQ
jgi:outer membrane beta-barrel protein